MKPLRIAWKQHVRHARADAGHLAGESPVTTWRGRAVVLSLSVPGSLEIGAIYDADGEVVQRLQAPAPHRRLRAPHASATTWPDEGLAIGVESDVFELVWVNLDGASHAAEIPVTAPIGRRSSSLVASTDGGVLVSSNVADVDLDKVDWPVDRRLNDIYNDERRRPFDDHEYVTDCVDAMRVRWHVPGRAVCMADEIAILEEGAGMTKQIVARDTAGTELWRQPAIDRFVVGARPLPAWSEDRVYVYDRSARRQASWAREAELARTYEVNLQHPMPAMIAMRERARGRASYPIVAPTQLVCTSARSGTTHWQVEVPGDIVSSFVHPAWIACVVAGSVAAMLHVWRHDGTPLAALPIAARRDNTSVWPPDAAQFPCIVHGDDTHVVIAENRTKKEGARLYATRIDAPTALLWEMPLPAPCVVAPLMRWLRLFNRVPIAFAGDAAYLRWGKQLFGLRA